MKKPKTDDEVAKVVTHSHFWSDREKATILRMKNEGHTSKEIADKLGRSKGAVEQQFFRLTVKKWDGDLLK